MKPYKGIVRLSCLKKAVCPDKVAGNVRAGCVTCESISIEILDLEDKAIAMLIPAKIVKPKKPSSNLKIAKEE